MSLGGTVAGTRGSWMLWDLEKIFWLEEQCKTILWSAISTFNQTPNICHFFQGIECSVSAVCEVTSETSSPSNCTAPACSAPPNHHHLSDAFNSLYSKFGSFANCCSINKTKIMHSDCPELRNRFSLLFVPNFLHTFIRYPWFYHFAQDSWHRGHIFVALWFLCSSKRYCFS